MGYKDLRYFIVYPNKGKMEDADLCLALVTEEGIKEKNMKYRVA